jgi:hypothetical protein
LYFVARFQIAYKLIIRWNILGCWG